MEVLETFRFLEFYKSRLLCLIPGWQKYHKVF